MESVSSNETPMGVDRIGRDEPRGGSRSQPLAIFFQASICARSSASIAPEHPRHARFLARPDEVLDVALRQRRDRARRIDPHRARKRRAVEDEEPVVAVHPPELVDDALFRVDRHRAPPLVVHGDRTPRRGPRRAHPELGLPLGREVAHQELLVAVGLAPRIEPKANLEATVRIDVVLARLVVSPHAEQDGPVRRLLRLRFPADEPGGDPRRVLEGGVVALDEDLLREIDDIGVTQREEALEVLGGRSQRVAEPAPASREAKALEEAAPPSARASPS